MSGKESPLENIRKLITKGNEEEAIEKLDVLLAGYAKSQDIERIVKTLELLVEDYPNLQAVRKRLYIIYRKRGQKDKAIRELVLLYDE